MILHILGKMMGVEGLLLSDPGACRIDLSGKMCGLFCYYGRGAGSYFPADRKKETGKYDALRKRRSADRFISLDLVVAFWSTSVFPFRIDPELYGCIF